MKLLPNIEIEASQPQRWIILAEISGFVAFALLSKYLMSLVFWRYAGPVSLLLTLALVTLYMRRIGIDWPSLGLRRLPGIKAKLMVIPQAMLVFVAFGIVVALTTKGGPAIGLDFMSDVPQGVEDRWSGVAGNLPMFLLWLVIVWTAAAFGEEMFFRGYLISRLQTAFSGYRFAPVLAVILPAIFFGYGHFYYQGWRGAIVTGGIALAFGTMFLLLKRNLWPVILLHGIIDTLTFTALYMQWE
ncbi:CPBP family intramembrane glutamic endopeptidase [uncultured Parasphingorhabdus sp.]|uniref:CPBP family intramembrane glutamic endopeptidase n=1 Tax=uncultured Parasphingorhabdus sp. TaxID=2709694 RepID=UPI0030DC3DA0|tara:strand:- start:36123 stop:36851 length:729 start_codon:yes stop_codon:yes gene_type:complete